MISNLPHMNKEIWIESFFTRKFIVITVLFKYDDVRRGASTWAVQLTEVIQERGAGFWDVKAW